MADKSSGERLTDVIFSNRMSKKEFAEALGYNPSYITQICLNLKPVTKEFAKKIEKLFGVSSDWLLSGKKPEQDVQTLAAQSFLKQSVMAKIADIGSDSELRAILAFINYYEQTQKSQVYTSGDNLVVLSDRRKLYRIPVKGEVAGGLPIIAYEKNDETVETQILADSALYLKGKSMEPEYPDGSLLLIKEKAYISNGDVVIALIMKESEIAEATCKVYHKKKGKITLSPINSEYNKQIYDGSDGIEIVIFGKVIGSVAR